MGGIPPRLCAGTEPGRVHLGLLEAARTAQCLPERLLGTRRDSAPDAQTHAAPTAAHHSLLAASQTVSLMSLYYANVNRWLLLFFAAREGRLAPMHILARFAK